MRITIPAYQYMLPHPFKKNVSQHKQKARKLHFTSARLSLDNEEGPWSWIPHVSHPPKSKPWKSLDAHASVLFQP